MDDFDDENTAFPKDNVEKAEKDDDDDTREVDKGERCTLTTRVTYRNLAGISVSFMLLFAAANSLQNVQSSINISEGLGTIGLMVIYFSVLLTSTFLPPLLFHRFGIKWAMIVSMSGYLAYAGAAFHATWATIIPASFLVGTGLCILWVGKLAFISELAKQYSKTMDLRISNVLSRFYGLFFTVSYIENLQNTTATNATCGIAFCSRDESANQKLLVKDQLKLCNHLDGKRELVVFALFVFLVSHDSRVALSHDATGLSAVWNVAGNLASSIVFSKENLQNTTATNATCGIAFCSRDESENQKLLVKDQLKLYIYAGFCVGCVLLAVFISSVLLDDVKPEKTKAKRSALKLLSATSRHVWESGYQKMLVPVCLYRGLCLSFLIGDFNAAFTSCTLGVENVGYVWVCYGVCTSIASLLLSAVADILGFKVLFILACIMHGGVYTTLFLWTPSAESAFVLYICVGIFGVGFPVYSAVLSSLYGKLFPNKTDAAMSCFNLLNSLGMVFSFALSSFLCTYVKLIIVFSSLILSTVCVILVVLHNDQKFHVHFKFWKPKRSRTRSNENVALS